jgi:hypothetical protein
LCFYLNKNLPDKEINNTVTLTMVLTDKILGDKFNDEGEGLLA